MRQKLKYIKMSIKHPGVSNSSTYMKYPKEFNFEGQRVLNLGCGCTTYPVKNVVNLDYLPGEGIDLVWDLSVTPLPFKDGEFDFIIANHVLEHVPNWWECFKELARITKVGGNIQVFLPGDGGSSQLGYRDHINIINSYSFGGIRMSHRNEANIWEIEDRKHLGAVKDLLMTAYTLTPTNYWWLHILPARIQMAAMKHLRNVVQEQQFIFKKLAPEGVINGK